MTEPVAPFAVSVVGVGNMGGAMAQRLLALGWPVQVCDVRPERLQLLASFGAVGHVLPDVSAMNSVVCIVAVVDAAQTEAVLFGPHGLAPALPLGSVVMLCPTLAPEDVEAFARRLVPFGLHAVDAPMSGGPVRALDGSMSLMVACASTVLERCRALLDALSSRVFHVSERVGDGARTKLVNNLAAAINLVGAAEVLVMAQKMGLDLGRTLDVIEQSSGQSWIGSDRMRRAIAGDYAPRAHLTLLQKDTRLAVAAAQAAGFAGPLGASARDVFAGASAAGLDALDDAALFDWLGRGPRMKP
ncbi:MAG: NAD(P)-dependent oxidoreductase [Burkholderiales bacterium]|nr:NAD(P)-dependent oxidoreductase [Burkholderiales bacterium]